MLKYNFKTELKSKLKNIRYWKKLNLPIFADKLVKIEVKNIKNIEIDREVKNKLHLEYLVTNTFIGFNEKHDLYRLSKDELETLIKDQYKLIKIESLTDYSQRKEIIKRLVENSHKVIPLDDEIYVETSEEMNISIDNIVLLSEDIE